MGKSLLVEQALGSNGAALVAHGHELTAGVPYYLLTEVVRRALAAGWRPSGNALWLATVAALVPELGELAGQSRAATDKAGLFDGLRRCLFALVAGTPTPMIVLEDLHWADRDTLEFLAALAPGLADGRPLVVATSRPDERLAALLERAGRVPWLQRIDLRPLDSAGLAALAGGLVGASGTSLGQRLHDASDGNPLFATSILAALVEDGRIWRDQSGDWQGIAEAISSREWPVPDEVQQLVRQRRATLTPAARHLLDAASVVDIDLDSTILTALVGGTKGEALGEAPLLDALDELLAADLLRADGGTPCASATMLCARRSTSG